MAVEGTSFGVRSKPQEVRSAEEAGAPPYGGMGQPRKPRPAPLYTAEESLEELDEEAWVEVVWPEGTKGKPGKRMVAMRAHRGTGSPRHSTTHGRLFTSPEGWLIGERPLPKEEGADEEKPEEIKHYFSELPEETSPERLAELAHTGRNIEQFFRRCQGRVRAGGLAGEEVGRSA